MNEKLKAKALTGTPKTPKGNINTGFPKTDRPPTPDKFSELEASARPSTVTPDAMLRPSTYMEKVIDSHSRPSSTENAKPAPNQLSLEDFILKAKMKNLAYSYDMLTKGISDIGSDPDNGSVTYKKISFPVRIHLYSLQI